MPLPDWMVSQPPHTLHPLKSHRLHVLGIGGRGLAPLAAAARALGANVTGCDPRGFEASLRLLRDRRIPVSRESTAEHLTDGRHLIATATARIDHPEVAAAASGGVLHRRMDLVAAVMASCPGAGVTGSHGKGTVTALAGAATAAAGIDPLVVVGASVPEFDGPLRMGAGPAVMEIDDSDLATHFVSPRVSVVTSLTDDHVHLSTTLAESVADLEGFVANASQAVVLGPGRHLRRLETSASAPVLRYGRDFSARVIRHDATATTVRFYGINGESSESRLGLVTPRIEINAGLAFATAQLLGATADEAAAGMERIRRIVRRLDPVGAPGGVHVYDDYGGKHPDNVRGGIAALRHRHPSSRIISVFQPVLGESISRWGWRYARALRLADHRVLLPVVETHPEYASRTAPHYDRWVKSCGARTSTAPDFTTAASIATRLARPGDVIVGFVQIYSQGAHFRSATLAALDA